MKRADQRKFHYIYKITREDGKYYIGMHSTDDLEDGYFGSGQLLWKSIKKHGKEKHSKEILEFLPSRKDLKDRERMLVNEELLGDPLCMNLKLGGEGGWEHLSPKIVRENAIKNSGFARFNSLPVESQRAIRSGQALGGRTAGRMAESTRTRAATNASVQNSAIEKRKRTFKERAHMQGENNSQFGTIWITNGLRCIKIKPNEMDAFRTQGWVRGRKVDLRSDPSQVVLT